ncbi:MAG: tetratricopeptide repeat protein [Gammaproteobacteria bacterium]
MAILPSSAHRATVLSALRRYHSEHIGTPRRSLSALFAAILCISQASVAGPQPSGREHLMEVPRPDLTQVEQRVRGELEAAAAEFSNLAGAPQLSDQELGSAYGELGALYHAHHMDDAAEACYLNAEQLVAREFRWPYLLGYLYQRQGRFKQALAAYRRAQAAQSDYPPLRLRLAEMYLSVDRPEQARPLFTAALETEENWAAATYGLGKIALLEGDYEQALQWFQQALRSAPQASRVHYQMAMAYRGRGAVAEARAHLAQRGDIEPPFSDPVVQTLEQLVAGARVHLYRAMQAVWAKKFERAAQEFRQVVTLEPENVSAHVGLARALYLIGRPAEAQTTLEAALVLAPDDAQAHYFLGRLLQEAESDAAAKPHYEATLATDPHHGGAHFFLANALMRARQFKQAARHYGEAAQRLPEDLPARQLQAMALIATPGQHRMARERLETAISLYPHDPVLKQIMARLLAASPQAALRDGERALVLARELLERVNSIEHAETVAMAYAELGDYRAATAFQQAAIDAAVQWGGIELIPGLQENLRRYQANKPCRAPWPEDDPVFYPRPIRGAEEEAVGGGTASSSPPVP